MLGADNSEVLITDDDLDINEQEKARELGMDLPEVAFSAGGMWAKPLANKSRTMITKPLTRRKM